MAVGRAGGRGFAGGFFEGADFFEAGTACGVAANEGLDERGIGFYLDEGVTDDFFDCFRVVGALCLIEFGTAGGEKRCCSCEYQEDCEAIVTIVVVVCHSRLPLYVLW